MTRALITGAGGQDAHYLARQLLAEGVEVHALAHDAEPLPTLPDVELHPGDITRADEVRALVLDLAPDELYNLAAVSSVARSWEEPLLTYAVNGTGAANLLEAAHVLQERSGHEVRVVQASSAEIFGNPDRSPQDEDTPIRPVNPYGAAKAFAHHACRVSRARDLHAATVILYNHESPLRPRHFVTRKITSTVAAISHNEADRLVLGNLGARRDWGWAPDYVDAMVRAARADRPDDFVIATGTSHSVRDFVAAAFACVGITDWDAFVTTDHHLARPTDARELVGDTSRARTRLGWAPVVGFPEVVARMVEADLAPQPGWSGSRRASR